MYFDRLRFTIYGALLSKIQISAWWHGWQALKSGTTTLAGIDPNTHFSDLVKHLSTPRLEESRWTSFRVLSRSNSRLTNRQPPRLGFLDPFEPRIIRFRFFGRRTRFHVVVTALSKQRPPHSRSIQPSRTTVLEDLCCLIHPPCWSCDEQRTSRPKSQQDSRL